MSFFNHVHTHRTTMDPFPSGQTPLATELIIHNRCSEMFSWIYDRAQRNSQVSLWCYFSLLSYKNKGFHRERISAQLLSPSPKIPLLSEIQHFRGRNLNPRGSLRNLRRNLLILPINTMCFVTWLIQQWGKICEDVLSSFINSQL